MTTHRFFLGGADLEMAAIRELLDRHASGRVVDKRLAWGARVEDYLEEILASLVAGETPVLVELADKTLPAAAFDRARCVIVDHHGERAGADEPCSLEQVFSLLGLDRARDWTRRLALIAANDKGHVRAMRALGADDDEIRAVRKADRRAQGVTTADEAAARDAIAQRTVEGRLTTVELPCARASVVADLIEPVLGGPGADQLLVIMPSELAFYGDGGVVDALDAETADVDGSWSGGGMPVRGFWGGIPKDDEAKARLLAVIRDRLI